MDKEVRVNVRIEPDLKRKVMSELALEGKTLTDLVVELLAAWLEQTRRERGAPPGPPAGAVWAPHDGAGWTAEGRQARS